MRMEFVTATTIHHRRRAELRTESAAEHLAQLLQNGRLLRSRCTTATLTRSGRGKDHFFSIVACSESIAHSDQHILLSQ